MKRVVKSPDVRKKELTIIALRQFLYSGYDKTSIRSILKEADGEVGMFYHYFKSKDEIYQEALNLFNQDFILNMELVLLDAELPFEQKIISIFTYTELSISKYKKMKTDTLNPEMLSTIHRQTLLTLVPLFEKLLNVENERRTLSLPDVNGHFLSSFILFGISAVIHDTTEMDFSVKRNEIYKILSKLVDFKTIQDGGINHEEKNCSN